MDGPSAWTIKMEMKNKDMASVSLMMVSVDLLPKPFL